MISKTDAVRIGETLAETLHAAGNDVQRRQGIMDARTQLMNMIEATQPHNGFEVTMIMMQSFRTKIERLEPLSGIKFKARRDINGAMALERVES